MKGKRKAHIEKQLGPASIQYLAAPASRMLLPDESFDGAIRVLTLAGIEEWTSRYVFN